jgi:membrane-associated protease RseP (regulator of RpoE activity)
MAYNVHPKDFKFEMPAMPNLPDFDVPVSVVVVHSSLRSGLMVENITPQLGEFFGVKNGRGVLVRSVEKGSRADKSGFRAGDVIVRVNDQTVHDTSDFSHALRSGDNDTVSVGIIRDKKEQNITLHLPDRRDSGEFWDESFDVPDSNAEIQFDLGEVRDQMAQLRPQLQYALQQSRTALRAVRPEIEKAKREALAAVEREKPEIERAMRDAQRANERFQAELCNHQKALQQQMHKMQRQMERQREDTLRQNKRQMERLRHELKGDWTQI